MADRKFWKGVVAGIGFSVLLGGSGFAGYLAAHTPSILDDPNVSGKIQLLEQMIEKYYYEEPDPKLLAEGLYAGLVYGLGDTYSYYYTAEDYEQENIANDGAYVGIGVEILKNENGFAELSQVYRGGSAAEAGLKKGDQIIRINGVDVTNLELSDVVSAIRTSEKDPVLSIRREGEDDFEVELELREISIDSVLWKMLDNDTAYLHISEFSGVTSDQFSDAMEEIREANAGSLLIDVRGNPGGILDSVCDVLRQILPEGLIVYTEDKYGNREEQWCMGESPLEMPLVVLADRNSASAAEVFLGAVKDYGIGTIVGTKSYGKGIVQTLRGLSDGSAIQLTTAKYYTPKGKNIHQIGIEPDVEVALDITSVVEEEDGFEMDNQIEAALEILRETEEARTA